MAKAAPGFSTKAHRSAVRHRARIEGLIETLVALLDEVDAPIEDLEGDHPEPNGDEDDFSEMSVRGRFA